jgi:hypothetical protein
MERQFTQMRDLDRSRQRLERHLKSNIQVSVLRRRALCCAWAMAGAKKRSSNFFAWRIVVQVNYRTVRPAVFDQPRDSTMNGHGGKRPGAGRPNGAASRANEEVRQEAAATGELPLAYMLRIMRDPSQPVGRRDDMAKAAAPFCHSRLSSVPPTP